jgi:hypothetical protein
MTIGYQIFGRCFRITVQAVFNLFEMKTAVLQTHKRSGVKEYGGMLKMIA